MVGKRRHCGALRVDLPIRRHEQLYGLEAGISWTRRSGLPQEFIGYVFDRVSENAECAL
jgi:hypothetical protein